MLTQLGKELRKLRIDREEKLLDMAKKLGISSAFLSAVEIGKKPIPAKLVDQIIAVYDLGAELAAHLRQAMARSQSTFTLHAKTFAARDTAALLARRFDELPDAKLQEIRKILEGRGK